MIQQFSSQHSQTYFHLLKELITCELSKLDQLRIDIKDVYENCGPQNGSEERSEEQERMIQDLIQLSEICQQKGFYTTYLALQYGILRTHAYSPEQTVQRITQLMEPITDQNVNILLVFYNLRGYCYFKAEQYDRAIADYTKALELYPKLACALFYRSDTLIELEKYEEALQDLNLCIEVLPTFADAYLLRSQCCEELKNDSQSFDDLHQALRLDPTDFITYNSLSNAYWARQMYIGSLHYLNISLTVAPDEDFSEIRQHSQNLREYIHSKSGCSLLSDE